MPTVFDISGKPIDPEWKLDGYSLFWKKRNGAWARVGRNDIA